MDDLLLLRPPDVTALATGPPRFLVKEFESLHAYQAETLRAADADLSNLNHQGLRNLVTVPLLHHAHSADPAPRTSATLQPLKRRRS